MLVPLLPPFAEFVMQICTELHQPASILNEPVSLFAGRSLLGAVDGGAGAGTPQIMGDLDLSRLGRLQTKTHTNVAPSPATGR